MKNKLLILDVDGTLTTTEKKITEATKDRLLALEEAGIKLVIATGRPTPGIRWIIDTLRMRAYGGYTLTFNGAKVTDLATDNIIYQNTFPNEMIRPLYDYAVENGLGMISYEGDTVIHGTRWDEYMAFEARLNFMELKQVEDFPSYIDYPVNKCLITSDPAVSAEHERILNERYGSKLSIYRSETCFIEAMPHGVDKAASLEKLFAAIGVDKKETVACGDGFNDISMIRFAGTGVCMQNGQQKAKEVADYVTERTNDEDGIIEVIDRFF